MLRGNPQQIPRSSRLRRGPALALIEAEPHVFRAAVLSIVLTLASGQTPAFFCVLCCHADEPATPACSHQKATPMAHVAGDDTCSTPGVDIIAVGPEDARRGPLTNHAAATICAHPLQPGRSQCDSIGYSVSRRRQVESPPRAVPLRI
jgi:hypothetical protein